MEKFKSIVVLLIMVCAVPAMSGMESVQAQEQVRPIAIVHRFQPEVLLANAQGNTYNLVLEENTGEQMFSGDTLSTEETGYALVIFTNDRSIAKVKPQSRLIIRGETLADSKISDRRIDLDKGEVRLEMESQGSATFEVSTSRSLASVKGTVFGNNSNGYVWVEEGQVDLTALNSGQTISLFQKQFGQVDENGNNIESGTLSDDELNNLSEDYENIDGDMVPKVIRVTFRDANGQTRTVEVPIFEKGN